MVKADGLRAQARDENLPLPPVRSRVDSHQRQAAEGLPEVQEPVLEDSEGAAQGTEAEATA